MSPVCDCEANLAGFGLRASITGSLLLRTSSDSEACGSSCVSKARGLRSATPAGRRADHHRHDEHERERLAWVWPHAKQDAARTTDGTAFRIYDLVKGDRGLDLPSNPCMSPNFLTTMLSIGPSRKLIARDIRQQLPVALDIHRLGYGVPDLAALAEEIRREQANAPGWVIQRQIRSRMNQLKSTGTSVADGEADTDEDVLTEVARDEPTGS